MEERKPVSDQVRDALLPRGPGTVAEPEKELRFTRARQAPLFYGLAVMAFAASMAVFILSTQDWGMAAPLLHGWWWLCVPGLLMCFWLFRIGVRCTRHAYIILSPLGVEIFPFFKAAKNLQVIYWSQVADASVEDDHLVIHFSEQKSSGVVASLKPVAVERRALLATAVAGVMAKRHAKVD
jgi:hypothetical protein